MVHCKELIVVEKEKRGNGTIDSPFRNITQVYDKHGVLIAEKDSLGSYSFEELLGFADFCINNKSNDAISAFHYWQSVK